MSINWQILVYFYNTELISIEYSTFIVTREVGGRPDIID